MARSTITWRSYSRTGRPSWCLAELQQAAQRIRCSGGTASNRGPQAQQRIAGCDAGVRTGRAECADCRRPSRAILETNEEGARTQSNRSAFPVQRMGTGLHPVLAPNCYEQCMTMVQRRQQRWQKRRLLSWVDIVAGRITLTKLLLEALPQSWNTAALPPLSAVLRGDLSELRTIGGWNRVHGAKCGPRFLLAVGHSPLRHNRRSWKDCGKPA